VCRALVRELCRDRRSLGLEIRRARSLATARSSGVSQSHHGGRRPLCALTRDFSSGASMSRSRAPRGGVGTARRRASVFQAPTSSCSCPVSSTSSAPAQSWIAASSSATVSASTNGRSAARTTTRAARMWGSAAASAATGPPPGGSSCTHTTSRAVARRGPTTRVRTGATAVSTRSSNDTPPTSSAGLSAPPSRPAPATAEDNGLARRCRLVGVRHLPCRLTGNRWIYSFRDALRSGQVNVPLALRQPLRPGGPRVPPARRPAP
jgi:hypothetical protein